MSTDGNRRSLTVGRIILNPPFGVTGVARRVKDNAPYLSNP